MSLKEKIKKAPAREPVTVEAWGQTLEVRPPTVAERNAFFDAVSDDDGSIEDANAMFIGLIIHTAFDPETGERVFDESDTDWLLQADGAEAAKVFEAAQEVSGFARKSLDQAKKSDPD